MNLPPAPDQDVVIFGGTGDLSRRKLIPALYDLFLRDSYCMQGRIICLARSDFDDERLRDSARVDIERAGRQIEPSSWQVFRDRLSYIRLDDKAYERLTELCQIPNRLFYLAVPPGSVQTIVRNLGAHGLASGSRLLIEKPFGEDLASARELSRIIHEFFDEQQVYRIDHYLGKETVQNILIFRFANAFFERNWNRDAIHRIEITVAEAIGIEGRGSFYEGVGALKDIVQSHVLQMLALVTMEPPYAFEPEAIREERGKVLRAVRPVDPSNVVRGQYTAAVVAGEMAPGYQEEHGVAAGSQTETFVAMKLEIDNWRWAGVPVLLRTGKRLPVRTTEVEIVYKDVPSASFEQVSPGYLHANHLTLNIQPEENIVLKFVTKVPGPEMKVDTARMTFSYGEHFMAKPEEAYARLIYDALRGDSTLFVREDAIDRAWQILEPVMKDPPPLHYYPAGSWGPVEANRLVVPEGWHPPG